MLIGKFMFASILNGVHSRLVLGLSCSPKCGVNFENTL